MEEHPELNNEVEIEEEDYDEMQDIWNALCELSQQERGEIQGKVPVVILYQVFKFVLENPKSGKISLVKLHGLDISSESLIN